MSDGAGNHAGGAPSELASLIDAYLDGVMTPDQKREFEARAQSDPVVARELALQRRADESLRRQFQPPATPVRAPGAAEVIGRHPGGRARAVAWRPLAAAAAIVMALGAGYWALNGGLFGAGRPGLASPQVVYHRVIDGGFKPEWVCEDDHQFVRYTKERFGAAWKVLPQHGLKLVGWRYSSDLLGPEAALLLAEQDGQKIVVAVDEAGHDRRLRDGDGLHVFRRTLGGVVLYEISPLDKPSIVERVEIDPGS